MKVPRPKSLRAIKLAEELGVPGEYLGGPAGGGLFTILAGAKRHRLEPWAYVRDALLHLSTGETDLKALLPDRWAVRHPEHVLEHRLDESRQRAARQQEKRQRRRASSSSRG